MFRNCETCSQCLLLYLPDLNTKFCGNELGVSDFEGETSLLVILWFGSKNKVHLIKIVLHERGIEAPASPSV